MNEKHKILRELVENHWVKAQDCSALNMYNIVCDVTNIMQWDVYLFGASYQ